MSRSRQIGGALLRLIEGDIIAVAVDAIVNAANSALTGGGGVDGAIHRVGGPALMLELNKIRPRKGCPTGSAVITGAGTLPAKKVIHAVGPVWRGGGFDEEKLLASAYKKALELAAGAGAQSVSFPSISTGAYGYPLEKAAPIAVAAVASFLEKTPGPVKDAVFVLFDKKTLEAYERALRSLSPK